MYKVDKNLFFFSFCLLCSGYNSCILHLKLFSYSLVSKQFLTIFPFVTVCSKKHCVYASLKNLALKLTDKVLFNLLKRAPVDCQGKGISSL